MPINKEKIIGKKLADKANNSLPNLDKNNEYIIRPENNKDEKVNF